MGNTYERHLASPLPIGHCGYMGIPDRESWWWNSYAPMGRATGWRRWGMLVVLAGLLLITVGSFLIVVVRGIVSLVG